MSRQTGAQVIGASDKLIAARFRRMARRAETPEVVWKRVGTFWRSTMRKQFTSEGAYLVPGGWKPLKPSYLKAKRKAGFSGRILVRSGDMRDSFVNQANENYVQRSEGKKLVLGSDHPLAKFHQYGTTSHKTGKRLIPARKIVRVTSSVRKGVDDIILDYIVGRDTKGTGILR